MDVAVLAEVVVSVYMASHSSRISPRFPEGVFRHVHSDLAAGIVAIRRFRDRHPATSATEAGA